MNLCDKQAMHCTFGEGRVKSVENGYITVEFSESIGQKVFSYPGVFERFLILSNTDAQAYVECDLKELLAKLAAEEAEKKLIFKEEQEQLQAERRALHKAAAKKPVRKKTQPNK